MPITLSNRGLSRAGVSAALVLSSLALVVDAHAADAPAKLTVTAADFSFAGVPASIKGGLTMITLKNTGKSPHDLQLLKIDGVHTDAEAAAVTNSPDGAPIPAWIHGAGGVGTVAPGKSSSATLNLDAGTYVYVSTESDEEKKTSDAKSGMVGRFTVKGTKSAASLSAPATIASKEYGFDVTGLKAGANTVLFKNSGKQLHHVVIAKIRTGKTIADVKASFSSNDQSGPPPVDFATVRSAAAVDPGVGEVISLNLPAGSYAFMCFISDRAGGPPHFTKGMLQEVVVK